MRLASGEDKLRRRRVRENGTRKNGAVVRKRDAGVQGGELRPLLLALLELEKESPIVQLDLTLLSLAGGRMGNLHLSTRGRAAYPAQVQLVSAHKLLLRNRT